MKKYLKIGLFKSKGRIIKETISKYRTPFQRDRDRIIHSASFRRLKHKTQVFVNTEGDHYRTRITHSMEVAQIARSIARYLNLNLNQHDIGSMYRATLEGIAFSFVYGIKFIELFGNPLIIFLKCTSHYLGNFRCNF